MILGIALCGGRRKMAVVGMIIMFFGFMCSCVGWNDNPKNVKYLVTGVLILSGGICIGVGGSPAKGMPDGSPGIVAIGLVLFALGIVIIFIEASAVKKRGTDSCG